MTASNISHRSEMDRHLKIIIIIMILSLLIARREIGGVNSVIFKDKQKKWMDIYLVVASIIIDARLVK